MPRLSSAQFADLAGRLVEPDGGFSVKVSSGREPESGYMVSQAGTTRSYGPEYTVTGPDVEAYEAAHNKVLGRTGRYLGGWHNPDNHKKDLDVSRRLLNHENAVHEMWAQDQDALYNLNHRDEDNPYGRSERNYEKLGTADSPLHRILQEAPDPDFYREVRQAAVEKRLGRRPKPPAFLTGRSRRREARP